MVRKRINKIIFNLLMLALTFIGLSSTTFLIGRVMPIDPVISIAGQRVSQSAYDKIYHELGLDKPLLIQYFIFLKKAVTGDFGVSITSGNPVWEDIKRVFPASVELALVASLIGIFVGVPMGMLAAFFHGKWVDYIIRVTALLGYSVPIFWLGIMSLVLFYRVLDWLPGPGRIDFYYIGIVEDITNFIIIDALIAGNMEIVLNALSHLILPSAMLGVFALAYVARMTRSFMLHQLNQEYVLTARVKGLPEWKVVTKHILPNMSIQLITIIALTFALLLEGSVLIETVFVWPGLGQYVIYSLLSGDMNATIGGTTVVGTIFVLLNQLSDLLYQIVDPRAS
jgi:peptide/nickel transport system permease protein